MEGSRHETISSSTGTGWEDNWALKGLAAAEIETFKLITNKLHEYEQDRCRIKTLKKIGKWKKHKTFEYCSDPILRKATEKLKLRRKTGKGKLVRDRHEKLIGSIFYTDNLSTKEIQNILQATRKALVRRGNVDKKLESMASNMGEGEETPHNLENFIVYLMKEIGLHQETDNHAVRALENYINRKILRNPNSMYAVLEPVEVRVFAENTVRRFKSIGGSFRSDTF